MAHPPSVPRSKAFELIHTKEKLPVKRVDTLQDATRYLVDVHSTRTGRRGVARVSFPIASLGFQPSPASVVRVDLELMPSEKWLCTVFVSGRRIGAFTMKRVARLAPEISEILVSAGFLAA